MSRKLSAGNSYHAKSLFEWWNNSHEKDEKKTQAALADFMKTTPQILNAKLNGKRTLTSEDAKRIVEFFPGSRIEYVMGFDDHITDHDLLDALIEKHHERYEKRIDALIKLASLRGFEIALDSSGLVIGPSGGYEDIYRIEQDGSRIFVPYTELMDWIEDISDFVEVKLNRQLKQRGGSENNG